MPKFYAPLDLNRAELRNAVTQNLVVPPPTPLEPGLRYYNSVTNDEQYWNGTRWVAISDVIDVAAITGLGDLAYLDQVGTTEIVPGSIGNVHISGTAGIELSKLAVNPLDRANHTGTQLAATISDFDTQVRTNPINLLAPPTAPLDMANQTITGLGTPALPTDATSKAYVDSVASGVDVHPAARVATTANIDLTTAPATIDGVTLAGGDRVIVKNQTLASQNGIYTFASAGAPMARATDADADGELASGTYALVTAGTLNASTGWMVTTPNPITVGVTNVVWAQFSSGGSSYVGTPDRITVTGTQIDIAATYAGQASLTTLGTVTTGVWNGTPIDIAYGGTGATTAAGARAALGTIGKMTKSIGDDVATSFVVAHNFNTMAVGVELYELQSGQTVYADVVRVDPNNVRVEGFINPPAYNGGAGEFAVVVWG